MNTLFPIEYPAPAGFEYIPGFLTEDEEKRLLNEISKIELHNLLFQGYEAKRKTASFGMDWSFEKKQLSKGKEIPPGFLPLLQKVSGELKIKVESFAELLITEYPVGSVINWHRDAPPFDIIAGISLQSDCNFKFRPHNKNLQGRNSIVSIPVTRHSLYVMKGASRTEWQHSVAPVRQIRYSITLRTLKLQ